MTRQKQTRAPKPPKPPGKVQRAVERRTRQAARVTLPYAVTPAASVLAAAALHTPGLSWAGGGATVAVAAIRLHEAHGWHRKGGKSAARKRRKFQGTATGREMRRHLSVSAARKRARVTRPSVGGTRGLPPGDAGVLIGTAGRTSRSLYGTHEDFYAVFGPQRSGKTGWMAGTVIDAPGACLTASTRVDMWAHTSIPRSARGPVLILNPAMDGGIRTTFTWNPLDGCETAAGAILRAGYMMDAAPKDSTGKDAWWDAQGARLLRWMLHAGSLAGASMTEVARWVADPLSTEPASILADYREAAPGWADELAALAERSDDGDYIQNVSKGAVTALDWLSDPAMAAIACPRDSWEGFDAVQFLTEGGTVYLVGTDRPHNSLAPYFATFTAHLFDTAKQLAAASTGTRLDPPLTLVIDEPAITCPVPLDRWSAEAGGHGVTLVTGFQSRSQLSQRWGPDGAKTIWNNATVKLIYGGFTDDEDLEAFSRVCGERDTWDHVKAPDGGKTKQPRQERVFPPERIRLLPEGSALVLHRRTRPLVAAITPVWDRPDYERATPGTTTFPVPVPEPQPAIEAAPRPPRPPIPLPAAPPAPPVIEDTTPIPALVPDTPEEIQSWHPAIRG